MKNTVGGGQLLGAKIFKKNGGGGNEEGEIASKTG